MALALPAGLLVRPGGASRGLRKASGRGVKRAAEAAAALPHARRAVSRMATRGPIWGTVGLMSLGLALATGLVLAADPIAPSIATPNPTPTPTPTPTSTSTPTPTSTSNQTPNPTSLTAAPADVRARFDAARAALVAGAVAAAERGFADVAADPSATPGLAEAARILAETCADLARRGLVLRGPVPGERGGKPFVDRSGRGQLGWFSTIYGIAVADTAGAIAGVDDTRVFIGLTIAGGAGGLALALGTTRDGPISKGRAAAIQAATLLTSVNAAALSAIGDLDGKAGAGVTIAAGLVAYGATAAATRDRAPSEGDVSLASSGGFWGFAAGALALTFLDDPSGEEVGWILLGGTDLGLVAGTSLARTHDVSRSRVLVVDAVGLLGALAGVAVPAFASSDDPAFYGAATLAGITAGLGLGTYWTRDWEGDERAGRADAPAPFATRLPDGTLVAGVTGRF
jgi:hypothetical protein